jgi:putative membrane protein
MKLSETGTKGLIVFISIILPLFTGYLIYSNKSGEVASDWVYMLPHINGMINSFTVLILFLGFILIRRGNIVWHKMAMLTAFFLGILFFISYTIYHANVPSQVFGDINNNNELEPDELIVLGYSRAVYLSLLLSHIVLAVILAPFILMALFYAFKGKIDRHKKIVRFALPIWIYVSISGVIVYLMISQYY